MDQCQSIPQHFHIDEGSGCFFESVAQVLAQIKPSELNITGESLFKQCNTSMTIPRSNPMSLEEAQDVGQTICENYNVRLHIIKIQNKDEKEIWTHEYVDKHGNNAMLFNYEDDDTIHIICQLNDFHFKPILRSMENVPKTPSSSKQSGDDEDIINAIKSNDIGTLKELLNISPTWLLRHFPFPSQIMDNLTPQMHRFLDEALGLQQLYVSMENLSKKYTTENELLDVICASLETFKTYADYFLVKKGLTQHRMNLVFFSLIAERYENWMQIRINQQNGVEISRKTLKEIQLHLTKLLFPLHEYNKIFSTRGKLKKFRLEFLKSNENPFRCWETYRNSVTENDEINTIYQTYRFGRSQCNLVNALSAAFEATNNKTSTTTQATTIDSKPYLIMKDIYVLDRILHYLDLSLSKGLENKEMSYVDQLVLERALQVTGEYMKNTDETPNLSEEIQIKLAAAGVQIKLLTEVRNMLSHYTSKQVFSEINVNDRILLENVHKDLEKVRGVILKVLRQVKINQVQHLLCNDGSILNNTQVEVVTQIKLILEDIKLSMSKHDIKLSFEKLMSILKDCSLFGDIDMVIHEILCVILPDIIQERIKQQNQKLETKSEIFQKYDDQKFGIYDHDWTDCKSVISKISSLKEIENFRKTKITDSNNSRNLHDLSLADILVKVIMEEALVKKDFKAMIVKLKFGFQADLDTAKLKEKNSSSNTLFLDAISEITNSKLDNQLNYCLEKYLDDSDLNDLLVLMKVQETQKQDFQNLLSKFRVQIATIAKSTQVIDNILTRAFDSISKLVADTPETTLTEEHFQMLNVEVENKRATRIAKIKLTILCGGINKVLREEFNCLVSKFKCNVKEKEWEECYKNRRKCKTILEREVSDPYDKLVNAMEKGLDLNGIKQCFINFIESLPNVPKSATAILKQKTADVIEAIFEENFEKQYIDTIELTRKLGEEIKNYNDNEYQKEHFPRWKTNERLKAALEMAILKTLNTLSVISTPKVCKKLEKLIHTSVGRRMGTTSNYMPLRNYLAHGDAMIDMRNTKMRDYLTIFADILMQNGRAIMAVNKIINNTKNCSLLQTILLDENLTRVVEQNPEIWGKEIQIIVESEYWKNYHWKADLLNMLRQDDSTEDEEVVIDFSFSEFLQITEHELRTAISFGDLQGTKFFLNHKVGNCDKVDYLHLATENGNLDVLRFLLKRDFRVNATNQINYTPLHYAVLNQNTEAARCLLVNEANARVKDNNGYTPLHIAAFSGATETILLLIQYGANVKAINGLNATPLLLAVWNGHNVATETLITAGALVNVPEEYLNRIICLAADEGYDQIVQALLIGGVKADCSIENAWTPLHQATRKGHLNVVNVMIDNGANVSAKDAESITPLHLARSTSIAETLINAGADINSLSNSRTPLHLAVGECAYQVVELLLQKGANIEARTRYDWLASHIAAFNGYTQIMRLLLKAGASVNATAYINTDVRRKVTPLHLACMYAHSDMVSLLLQENANVNDISYEIVQCPQTSVEKTQRFEWPLQIAISRQHFEMANILLEHGVDIAIVDDNDVTALHYASYYGSLYVVQKLLEKGSNINAVAKDSMTPLYCAAMSGSLGIIQLLINQGADLDHRKEGDTILHYAVQIQKPEVVDLLLKNGFSSNIEGNTKRTPLHLVCIMESEDENESNREILQLLLNHGANVNAGDLYNDTPLHLATKKGDAIAVNTLIIHGANPNLENLLNASPLQLAKQHSHDECYVLMQNLDIENSNTGKYVNMENTSNWTATRENIVHTKPLKTAITWITNLCNEVVTGDDLKALKELLADELSQNVNLNNYQLLHICVVRKNDPFLKELLAYGLNINHVNNEGLTPLHLAIQTMNQEAVCSLLKAGADVNSSTRDNAHSALHLAIQNEVIDILEILLDNDNIITDITNLNDETPLTLACKMGRLDMVNLLINHKCKINGEGGDRDTPLHVAVKYNQNQIVETLFSHGANAQAVGKMGNHPLHYSIILDTMQIAQMLIDHDADVNCLNGKHFTPLHIATQEDNEIAVEFLLKKEAKVHGVEADTDSPLHLAVDRGHSNIMEILIKNNANVNAKNGQKQTPLHLAAIKGDYAMVEYLLENGANTEITDGSKCTPLFLAVQEGHYGLVQLLIKNGACVNSTCEDDWGIIHKAVQTSDVAMVEEVLKYGGNIDCAGKKGWTPLHLAIANDCLNIVKLLIDNEAKINVPDNVNEFPIHVACKTGNYEITEMLIKAGANVNCCNEKGRTPLLIAIRNQRENCIKVLLENNASIDSVSFNGQRSNALEVAIGNLNLTAVKMLIENGADVNFKENGLSFMHSAVCFGSADILEILHGYGLNVDTCGNDDRTPLHFAVTAGHIHCVRFLLAAGANINATTRYSRDTPLLLALGAEKTEIAGILIENGANVNDCNKEKVAPLHLAAEYGLEQIIQVLLDKGVAVDQQIDSGLTALCNAIYYGHFGIVKKLLHYGASTSVPNVVQSLLHIAAVNGNVEIIKLILENLYPETDLASYLNAIDEDGYSPLTIAAAEGHKEATELLLMFGAECNIASLKNTPLNFAASRGHTDILELLINHACKLNQKDENGNTALHLASSQGHLKAVKLLLRMSVCEEHGATDLHINQTDNNECSQEINLPTPIQEIIDNLNGEHLTALLASIIQKHEDIAIALIEAGADVNISNDNGDSPLMFAILKRLPNVVRKLTKHGADVNAVNDESGTALHFAINENNPEILQYLTENGANMLVQLRDDNTLLHYAISLDKQEMIPYLLKFGLVNIVNNIGRTPLHYASHKGFANIVSLLLQSGADVNAKDHSIRTPLHDVVLGMSENSSHEDHDRNEQQMEEFLLAAKHLILKDADVNTLDESNQNVLYYAVYFGYTNLVKLLLDSKANVNGNLLEDIVPPLQYAAGYGYTEITRMLLGKGAIVDEIDKNGWTALSKSVRNGHMEITKILLQCGASIILNNESFSIMHPTAFNGNVAIMKLILENLSDEADVAKVVNAKDQNGSSPLMYASECKHLEIAQLLLMIGADVNAVNNSGWSALHWAASLGLTSMVSTLLDYGSNVNLKCKAGSTALYLSIRNRHSDVVQVLLQNNADATGKHGHSTILHEATSSKNLKILNLVLDKLKSELQFNDYLNAQDTDGDTPLMWAIEGGNLEATKTLLKHGASINVKNNDGMNGFDWAYKTGHDDIIHLLKNDKI